MHFNAPNYVIYSLTVIVSAVGLLCEPALEDRYFLCIDCVVCIQEHDSFPLVSFSFLWQR